MALIWFALIIPFITSIIIMQFWKDKAVWWEFIILFGVTPLAIFLCTLGAESSVTKDTEYWGSYAVDARYYEPWNERVSCSHAVYRTETYTYTDSKGRTRTGTRQGGRRSLQC